VNGEKIGLQEYEKALGQEAAFVKGEPLKAEQASSLREEVLNRLIDEKIMLQRARELSITVSDAELEARIADIKKDYSNDSFSALFNRDGNRYSVWKQDLRSRMLLEKVIAADVNAKIVVTDSEAEAYFNANRKTYRAERRVHALQIVVRDREVARRSSTIEGRGGFW
jgi:FKBP-type peptidyl-prolyl cis-trans isomerase (trigger factor)